MVAYKLQDIIQESEPTHCKVCCHSAQNFYANIMGNINMYTRSQTLVKTGCFPPTHFNYLIIYIERFLLLVQTYTYLKIMAPQNSLFEEILAPTECI